MKSKRKPPISIIAASVLLCLVLVSVHITSGMFARYIVSADNPDNDSRAAAFHVSAQAPTEAPVTIVADGTDTNGRATYTVRVKNDGETAVKYDAVVSLKDEDKAKFRDSEAQLSFDGFLDVNGVAEKQLTFDMSEYFQQNDKYSTFSNDDISGNMGKCPFTVDVKFTQVD